MSETHVYTLIRLLLLQAPNCEGLLAAFDSTAADAYRGYAAHVQTMYVCVTYALTDLRCLSMYHLCMIYV